MSYGADAGPVTSKSLNPSVPSSWRYVRLSHNRRYLHYADFEEKASTEPRLDALHEKSKCLTLHAIIARLDAVADLRHPVDLSIVSSVVSNVSASAPSSSASDSTLTSLAGGEHPDTSTRITIHGFVSASNHARQTSDASSSGQARKEVVLLQLHPQSHTRASEWLDGLLMLLNQQPITADTSKLVNLIGGYGLKIRLLNVRFEDTALDTDPVMPSREGLDDNYYYEMASMEAGV